MVSFLIFQLVSYIHLIHTYLLVVGEKTVGEDVVDEIGSC